MQKKNHQLITIYKIYKIYPKTIRKMLTKKLVDDAKLADWSKYE